MDGPVSWSALAGSAEASPSWAMHTAVPGPTPGLPLSMPQGAGVSSPASFACMLPYTSTSWSSDSRSGTTGLAGTSGMSWSVSSTPLASPPLAALSAVHGWNVAPTGLPAPLAQPTPVAAPASSMVPPSVLSAAPPATLPAARSGSPAGASASPPLLDSAAAQSAPRPAQPPRLSEREELRLASVATAPIQGDRFSPGHMQHWTASSSSSHLAGSSSYPLAGSSSSGSASSSASSSSSSSRSASSSSSSSRSADSLSSREARHWSSRSTSSSAGRGPETKDGGSEAEERPPNWVALLEPDRFLDCLFRYPAEVPPEAKTVCQVCYHVPLVPRDCTRCGFVECALCARSFARACPSCKRPRDTNLMSRHRKMIGTVTVWCPYRRALDRSDAMDLEAAESTKPGSANGTGGGPSAPSGSPASRTPAFLVAEEARQGCQWSGVVGDSGGTVLAHVKNCVFRPWRCARCSTWTRYGLSSDHTASCLGSGLRACRHCSQPLSLVSVAGHEASCPKRPVACGLCSGSYVQENQAAHEVTNPHLSAQVRRLEDQVATMHRTLLELHSLLQKQVLSGSEPPRATLVAREAARLTASVRIGAPQLSDPSDPPSKTETKAQTVSGHDRPGAGAPPGGPPGTGDPGSPAGTSTDSLAKAAALPASKEMQSLWNTKMEERTQTLAAICSSMASRLSDHQEQLMQLAQVVAPGNRAPDVIYGAMVSRVSRLPLGRVHDVPVPMCGYTLLLQVKQHDETSVDTDGPTHGPRGADTDGPVRGPRGTEPLRHLVVSLSLRADKPRYRIPRFVQFLARRLVDTKTTDTETPGSSVAKGRPSAPESPSSATKQGHPASTASPCAEADRRVKAQVGETERKLEPTDFGPFSWPFATPEPWFESQRPDVPEHCVLCPSQLYKWRAETGGAGAETWTTLAELQSQGALVGDRMLVMARGWW